MAAVINIACRLYLLVVCIWRLSTSVNSGKVFKVLISPAVFNNCSQE